MITGDSPSATAQLPPLALIAGPTASGKSDVAVRLALALEASGKHAVVINADSAQVYADLAVLSARPSPEEMQGIEHHLFGAWDGATPCSAADWAEAARRAIAEVHGAGHVPILVGGTGLYIRTLLDGIAPVPPIDAGVRAYARGLTVEQAREVLLRVDPQAAARLGPNDQARIVRALEVACSTGRTLAQWQTEKTGGIAMQITLHPVILLPPREWLYERCNRRFAAMLEQGAVEEVRQLLARKLDPALPVMRAIGVAEMAGHLRGEWPLEEAQSRASQATRNYAKRQYTWFRRQPPAEWSRTESFDVDIDTNFASLFQQ